MKILPLTYLGNIQYYQKLCAGDCIIDIHEHYTKQSYRNRCDILAANGVVALSVQVVKPSNINKCAVKDVRIDYSKRWQHQHWMSIVSSYKNSPYFDFFADSLEPFYTRKFDFLFDLNVGLMETTLKLLGSNVQIKFSEKYIQPTESDLDFRETLSPKPRLMKPDHGFISRPYYQVFSEKMDFVPNLSIIDLLLCEGSHGLDLLKL